MDDFHYVGTELDIFARATNWKFYVRKNLRKYVVGDVLEVGAGIGAATRLINDGTQNRWVCLEPDRNLAARIKPSLPVGIQNCEVITGTLADLNPDQKFDAILYIDVLEHIEDDKGELARAAAHLKTCGFLVVLAPALPWLYTPFDAAIGHYRRYTRSLLRAIVPEGLNEEKVRYLDSIGMMASVGNRLFLKSASPRVNQIRFWDRFMIPFSRIVDPIVAHSFGRSVLAIWHRSLKAGKPAAE
jgi:SAM-dependent methyltransferase